MKTLTIEKNITILINKITNKVGFMITHRDTAIELLSKYKESETKSLVKLVASNGICNGKLYFK